jgi:hypothetical protein
MKPRRITELDLLFRVELMQAPFAAGRTPQGRLKQVNFY